MTPASASYRLLTSCMESVFIGTIKPGWRLVGPRVKPDCGLFAKPTGDYFCSSCRFVCLCNKDRRIPNRKDGICSQNLFAVSHPDAPLPRSSIDIRRERHDLLSRTLIRCFKKIDNWQSGCLYNLQSLGLCQLSTFNSCRSVVRTTVFIYHTKPHMLPGNDSNYCHHCHQTDSLLTILLQASQALLHTLCRF